jgi:transposase InsO family protein
MEERLKMILEMEKGEKAMAMICREYGISRQTGYKWLGRYQADPCVAMLQDRDRRPLFNPRQMEGPVVELIIEARKRWPHWGPRKLRVKLKELRPDVALPAASTIGAILKRSGLVRQRKRRRRTPPYTMPFGQCVAPNQVWCIDFKGHFKYGNGETCYPLTLTDAFSRFLLRCEIVGNADTWEVRQVLESAFREFGLPEAIRSDNGPPFASTGLGGLSELSVWLIRLGIRVERIDPGKPQQNGRHERMHLTLKRETASPPRHSRQAQQRAFDAFRIEYNLERPHESLKMRTPTSAYAPSSRLFPEQLARNDYPFDVERAVVDKHGFMVWQGRKIRVGAAFKHELVELRPRGRRKWHVSFGPVVLGLLDENRRKAGIVPLARKPRVSAMSSV